MNLLLLAPDIQQEILSLDGTAAVCERNLRRVTAEMFWEDQRRLWRELEQS